MKVHLQFLIVSAVAVSAMASPPLTLNDALRLFRASGFDLLIADANIASARADEQIATALPNPSISVARGSTFGYDASQCAGCSSRSLSATIGDQAISDALSGRRRLRGLISRAAIATAAASRADIQRTLEFSLKQQVLSAEIAKRSLDFADQSRKLASDTLDLVQKRYHAGAVSEADVARADVQRLQAEQAVDSSRQMLEVAKAQIAFFLGLRDVRPEALDVSDDLVAKDRDDGRLGRLTRDALRAEAIAHRPDVEAARTQVARARSGVDLARRLRFPDFSPSLQYSQEGRGQNALQPPTTTFAIAAALPVLYNYRGEVAKAESDLRAQEIARDKTETQAAADVGAAFASFTSARERLRRMESSLLPQAARARDLVRLQYEKGAASLFEFLDAQRTLLATQNDYLQTLSDYWNGLFQLEEASGMELLQ